MAKIHFLYLDIQTGTYHGVNHGIAVLAAVLKQAGHRVSLHHLTGEVNPREVLKQIADIQPHLAAFSCTTNQYGFLEKYAKAIKERFNIPILVGGIHASLCPEEVIANPYVDMVCIGEGEYALRELAIRIDKAHDFTGIANLWIKNSAKAIIKDKVGLQVKNLDELPLPDYELFDMQRILRETNATLYLMGSRGCPFDCNYCCNQALSSIYGSSRYLRSYSVNYLLDMIEQLKHKFNPRQLFFEDDTFSLNKKWCLDFCRQYKAKLGLSFGANIRLDTISEELISALKDAGCNRLNFGIESGNEWLRKNILNRNISNQEIIERVGLIKKHHIKTYSYNMMGLPFETQEMIRDTITLNQQVEIDSGDVFFFYPFPKTKLYAICQNFGLLLADKGRRPLSSYMREPAIRLEHISRKQISRLYAQFSAYLIELQLFPGNKKGASLLKKFIRFVAFVAPELFNGLVFRLKQTRVARKLAYCFSGR